MPVYLIVLGALALMIVALGFVSVVSGSWFWSAATVSSILLWLVLAVIIPKWAHRPKDISRH
jgi:hypothetical protein